MNKTKKIDRVYLRQVYRAMPNHNRFYRILFRTIRQSVREFRSENPDGTYHELLQAVGQPEDIFASCLEMNPTKSTSRSTAQIIPIIIFFAVFLLTLFLLLMYIKGILTYHVFREIVVSPFFLQFYRRI